MEARKKRKLQKKPDVKPLAHWKKFYVIHLVILLVILVPVIVVQVVAYKILPVNIQGHFMFEYLKRLKL